jgi:hypothetical protein
MRQLFIIILFSLFSATCRQVYVAPYKTPDVGYLVVEGVINSGPGTTTIKLSRTTMLSDGSYATERGATVAVQDQNNQAYPLTEIAGGQYTATGLNLDPGLTYRLHILTAGKEYFSDYVAVNSDPPIDSISWANLSDGVHISANTHDPSGKAKYFQWDYQATWEIHSSYLPNSRFYPDDPYWANYSNLVQYWLYDSSTYRCWQSEVSQLFLLGSSLKYAIDSLSFPLTVIEPASIKLSVLYSIDVRQYAYSKDAYDFLSKMKKNSEQQGSVFDAQPTDLQGNIHCVSDPGEIVVGYVACCPIQEKRAFINNVDLPGWNYSQGCTLSTQANDRDLIKSTDYDADGVTPHIVPVDWLTRNTSVPGIGFIVTFTAAKVECVDCRLFGTTDKPSFWP